MGPAARRRRCGHQTGGMPQLLGAITGAIVDAGRGIAADESVRGKAGPRRNWWISVRSALFIPIPRWRRRNRSWKNRSTALRLLRAYCEGIHRVRTDKEGTIKVLARYTKVQDPEVLAELYRIYGGEVPRVDSQSSARCGR